MNCKVLKLYLSLFILISNVSFGNNNQNDTLIITNSKFNLSLNKYLKLYNDSTKKLKLEDVKLNLSSFKINKGNETPNLGFTKSNYWINFIIKNSNSTSTPLLEIEYPFFDTINIFIEYNNGIIHNHTTGDWFLFNKREIQHKNFIYPLNIRANEFCNVWVELKCNGEATSFPAFVIDSESLDNKDNKENILLGIYYGVILFALFLALFMGAALNEKTHYVYLFYLVAASLFQGSLDGLTFQYLWPNFPWLANHIIPISGGLSLIFLMIFSDSLLGIKSKGKISKSIFFILLSTLILLTTSSLIDGKPYAASIPAISFSALFVDILIFSSAIKSLKSNASTAKYFTVAFGFLLIMIIIVQIKNFGILPRVFITEYGIQIGSLIETILLSFALADRVRVLQIEKNEAQKKLLAQQEETIAIQKEANEQLEEKVKERTKEVVLQKEIIEEKNKDITDSINYAERIQRGILKSSSQLQKIFAESFILFKPKDIVSGDFYWFASLNTTPTDNSTSQPLVVLAAIDCTGHGIPGAFMSMVGNAVLNQTLKNPDVNSPADALNFLNSGIKSTLLKEDLNDKDLIKDGMDIGMVALNLNTLKLWFSGANNGCWIVRKNKLNKPNDLPITEIDGSDSFLIELKPNKQPIGIYTDTIVSPFTNKEIQLEKGDAVYLFSDGYGDQFGGEKDKKFGSKRFKEILCEFNSNNLIEGEKFLWNTHLDWRGTTHQIDDICVIGFRV